MKNDLSFEMMNDIDRKLKRGEEAFSVSQKEYNEQISQLRHCLCGHFESCEICRGENAHNEVIRNEITQICLKDESIIKDGNIVRQMENFVELSEKERKQIMEIKRINNINKSFWREDSK